MRSTATKTRWAVAGMAWLAPALAWANPGPDPRTMVPLEIAAAEQVAFAFGLIVLCALMKRRLWVALLALPASFILGICAISISAETFAVTEIPLAAVLAFELLMAANDMLSRRRQRIAQVLSGQQLAYLLTISIVGFFVVKPYPLFGPV